MTDTMPIARPFSNGNMRLDVFPAKVEIVAQDTGEILSYPRARVRQNMGNLEVWVEDQTYPHKPVLAYSEQINAVMANQTGYAYPRNKQHAQIQTAGATANVQALAGCGCGSKLQALPMTRTQQMQANPVRQALLNNFPNAVI